MDLLISEDMPWGFSAELSFCRLSCKYHPLVVDNLRKFLIVELATRPTKPKVVVVWSLRVVAFVVLVLAFVLTIKNFCELTLFKRLPSVLDQIDFSFTRY